MVIYFYKRNYISAYWSKICSVRNTHNQLTCVCIHIDGHNNYYSPGMGVNKGPHLCKDMEHQITLVVLTTLSNY